MKLKRLLALVGGVFCVALNSAFAQTDVTSTYITNAGFERCTVTTTNAAAGGSAAPLNIAGDWTQTSSAAWSSSAVVAYGGLGKVNGVSAPSADNAGNSGNTLGVSVGWGGTVTYQSATVTLPAGHYVLTVNAYNAFSKTQFKSLNGFVPTSGSSYLSTKTSFTASKWETDVIIFDLANNTEGKFQIGGQAISEGSNNNAKVFFDNITLTYTDPNLAAAQVTLGGYIKKATALNGVLSDATLGTAITTAQGVLDEATTSDACNTASTNLNTAISTALSGATPVALTNGNFDTTPNNTLDGESNTVYDGTLSTATSNPDNTKDMSANTGDHGYLYDVTGWTQYSKFNSTAAQGTTSEYGTAMPANGWSTNSTTPPTADMFGEVSGAALHLSAGWNDQARYMQEIASLTSGRYVFYYEVINQHSNTGIASNYTGVSGNAGDFYGTTNSFVYSDLKTLEQGVWKAQAFEFDVAKNADIKFFVGFTTSSSGSGNGAKLWIDNVLVYRIGDVIVSESDASTILAQVAALDDVVYNATDKSALATAKSTFESSKTLDNYNALNAALIVANASKDVYTALNTAITNVEGWTSYSTTVTDPIRSKYNNGSYSNSTTAADIYSEYQAAEIDALVDASATDYTSAILNPSFETGDLTCWSAESRNDTKVWPNNNATYTTSGVDGDYLFNSWGGTDENNVYQTIKNLPAGTYTLSALVAGFKGEELVVAANSTTNSVTVSGDKTVGYTVNVVFTLDAVGDVVIKASNTKSQDGSDASFIKVDNFRLVSGDVTTNDYTALNAAITAAEAKTLGFDKDEYAPYNNVAAIAALAAAKAVDQTVAIQTATLNAIVSALTSATWTANAEEVNAIYDGNFAIQSEHTTGPTALAGWSNPEGIRQLIKNTETYPGLNSATDKAAVFAWGNTTMIYGNTAGYTLPLNAYTLYELSFKSCGWADGDMGYVNVDVSDGNGTKVLPTSSSVTATKRIGEENPWNEFKIIFVTNEAGNYTLGMWTSKHTTFTDIVLKKAASQTLTFAEDGSTPKFAAGTYPTVTLDRTFSTTNRSTMVLPFALTADETSAAFEEVYELSAVEGQSIKLVEANEIEAGKPYLVKAKNATLSVSGKALDPTTTVTNTEVKSTDEQTTATFVGTFSPVVLTSAANANTYVVSSNTLYKVTSDVNVKAYRGYFTVVTTNGVKNFVLDFGNGETTSIEALESETRDKVIYNLAGQRVQKAQKGIFIVNGKKVVIK